MKTLTWHTKLAVGIAGLSAGAILAMALGVMAEDTELDSDPRVFPYRGVLELDGESFTGLADFRFTVTDEGECDFVEEHGDVDVFAGAFAVNIGANTNGGVDDCVFDAQRIFLHIAVRDAQDEGDFTALSGRQRINPVPFAYWAAEGSDLRINGNLQADSANINGNVSANSANINGHTNTGSLNSGVTTLGTTTINATDLLFGNNPGRGDLGRALVHFDNDTLSINHDGDFSGGTTIGSELRVQGDVRITGDIADTNSDVVISDGLVVTGNTIIRGRLSNDQGDVTIDNTLGISGDLQNFNSNLVTINDGLRVTGAIRSDSGLGDSDCGWTGNQKYLVRNDTREGGIIAAGQDDSFHTLVCADGRYMAGWQCRASDKLDDSCRAYCCRP